MTIVERALELVTNGSRIGLGSGRAAQGFVRALGERIRNGGLCVQGVPTSEETASLARQEGVPLMTLAEAGILDLTVDGADEVDPNLDLIKGYGRALVREKIVAASSRQLVILVGDEKLVPRLGTRGRLPVEVTPFGLSFCERRLREFDCRPTPCLHGGSLFVTDNGNHILDCQIDPIPDPVRLENDIRAIPGVVGTGLFLGMAQTVLVGDRNDFRLIEEMRRGHNLQLPTTAPLQDLVLPPAEDEPPSAELRQAIKQRIAERTGGRIQMLEVEVLGNRVVVRGCAANYYIKQLALQEILDVMLAAGAPRIELDVQVVSAPSKSNTSAP